MRLSVRIPIGRQHWAYSGGRDIRKTREEAETGEKKVRGLNEKLTELPQKGTRTRVKLSVLPLAGNRGPLGGGVQMKKRKAAYVRGGEKRTQDCWTSRLGHPE